MDGLTLITTAPSTDLPNVFAADYNKKLTVKTLAKLETFKIHLPNWVFHFYHETPINWEIKVEHDFSRAENNDNFIISHGYYDYEIEDEFWNKISWTFQVVAATPSLISPIVSFGDKIADWTSTEQHSIEINLKDQYGNPVISVPWIKQVEVEIGFDNDVNKNQIDDLYVFEWDAISYTDRIGFWVLHYMSNTATGSNATDGKYEVSFTSLAPTKAWYSPAKWDININKLNYRVTALSGTWVWEIWEVPLLINFPPIGNPFKFTPAVEVSNIAAYPEYIMRDIEVTFTGSITKNTLENNITDFKVQHILDIGTNLLLSFQNITNSGTPSWETTSCTGNNTWNWYTTTDTDSPCNLSFSWSSNILLSKSWNLSNYTSFFKATPKIVALADPNFSTDYSSIVSYKIGSNPIKYYSLQHTFGETINQQVKIAWIANSGFETSPDSTNKILDTTISKADLRMQIAKNVEMLTKNGVSNIPSNVVYSTGNLNLTSSTLVSWKEDTVIVRGADLIITDNITKSALNKLNAIVVLRENGVGWNIWISEDVQFISAVIFADGHLFSGNGITYYSDTPMTAKDQLFIKGSVVSHNTIGGASDSSGPKCPYRFNSSSVCDDKEAKRYDLNHFRYYIKDSVGDGFNPGTWAWEINTWPDIIDMTKPWYQAPMIVEYDTLIQSNPPKIFLNN